MKTIYFHTLILILLILQGCTFEPSGEKFMELDSTGKLPNVEVDLNLATDTIYITKNERLTFSYSVNSDQVNWAQFIINGQETQIYEQKSGSIDFQYYFKDTDKGISTLKMNLYTKSQTGSIADKVGAEGFMTSRQWTLVIKDSYSMGVKLKKAEFIDGSLRLSWDKFKGMDFKQYEIYRRMDHVQQVLFLVATIHSQEQTSYIDNNYHGEQSDYYVVTNGGYYSSSINLKGPLPELKANNNQNGDIQLTWEKPSYYKNLKGYRISFRDEKGTFQQIAEINNSSVESFIIPTPRFAYNYEFYLTMIPLSNNFYDEWYSNYFLSSKTKATYGVSTPTFYLAHSGIAPISYLKYDPEGILVFDHQKFATTKIIKHDLQILDFDVSSNNKYMVSTTFSPRVVYFDDLEDESKSKTLNLLSSFPLLGYSLSVSDLGTGIFFNDQTAILYDYLNDSKLAEIELGYKGSSYNIISPSGRYFFCITWAGGEYYQYKDKQIIRLPGFNDKDGNYLHSDYLPGENEKFIRTFSNRIEIVDCATWTIEKQWLFRDPISEAYNLDLKSGKLFLRQANQLLLFDVMNGTKEVLIGTGDSNSGYSAPFYNSGQILWGEGKGIDLNSKN
jgi:hypothetical protein